MEDLARRLKLVNPSALTDTLRAALTPREERHVLELAIDEVSFRIVDVEATGLSVVDDELIEIAVYAWQGGRTELLLDTLVRPERPLPARIAALTGISPDDLVPAPALGEIFEAIRAALGGDCLVAHHALSDLGYLHQVAWRFDPHWLPPPVACTLKLSRELMPEQTSHALRDLAEALHLPLPSHRARADALSTVRLLELLVVRARDKGARTLAELLDLQQRKPKPRPSPQLSPLEVEALPQGPGVYRFFDHAARLLSVGDAVDVRRRVREHLYRAATPASLELCRRARRVEATATESELDAFVLEGETLLRERPLLNTRNEEHGRVRYFRLTAQGAVTLVALPAETSGDTTFVGPIIVRRAERNVLRAVRESFGLSARGDRTRRDPHSGRDAFMRYVRGELDPSLEPSPEAREILTELRQSLFRAEAAHLDALRPFRTPVAVRALGAPGLAYLLSAGRRTERLALDAPDAAQRLAAWLGKIPALDSDLDLTGRRISAYVRAHPGRVTLEPASSIL